MDYEWRRQGAIVGAMRAHALALLSTVSLSVACQAGAPVVDNVCDPSNGNPLGHAGGATTDRFGVVAIYPTVSGGREWTLPASAENADLEWRPQATIASRCNGAFFAVSGRPRHDVVSPRGKTWWRNVEMTAYLRYQDTLNLDPTQTPHWTFYARGERHTDQMTARPSTINDGVVAPPGTSTWPGYPFSSDVPAPCLGTSIKGLLHVDGRVTWQKEISHTEGYTDERAAAQALPGGVKKGAWLGFKIVIRNSDSNHTVHMESWIDAAATGDWRQVTENDDRFGGWRATVLNLNGCGAAPFAYKPDQIITWAGPFVTFRSDNLVFDFKWASVREIAPLP
jgi:hypothetical protein